jgi:hypothetical protein
MSKRCFGANESNMEKASFLSKIADGSNNTV